MKMNSILSLVVVCTLISGCASVPKTPQDIDIRRASIALGSGETMVVIGGSSKAGGAAVGGAKGAGVGCLTAAVLCIGAGPFYPLCLAVFGTVGVTAGATTGAIVGAVSTENDGGIGTKRSMLTEAFRELGANQRLAVLVHQKSLEMTTLDPLSAGKDQVIPASEWTLRILMNELATLGSGPDDPYALQVSARIEIIRSGSDTPALVKEYQVQNSTAMYTAEWRANDDELVRETIYGLMATLATDILNDLSPIQLSLDESLVDYMVFNPTAADSLTQPITFLSSKENPSSNSAAKEFESDGLFDSRTGMHWKIVPTPLVNLSTAKDMCKSLEITDGPKYRLPTLDEFEQLWKRYKGNEKLGVFNEKEYNTGEEGKFTNHGYAMTFSFQSGASGQLYAANLVCVRKE